MNFHDNQANAWPPHVTVATIVERNGQFLMVYEESDGQQVYNQPAGHLDPNETLQQAAVREALEETGWHIRLTGVVGINLYQAPSNGVVYMRTTFIGEALSHEPHRPLDNGIIEAVWLSYEELQQRQNQLRSPMTLQVIDDYRAGRRFPLEVVG